MRDRRLKPTIALSLAIACAGFIIVLLFGMDGAIILFIMLLILIALSD